MIYESSLHLEFFSILSQIPQLFICCVKNSQFGVSSLLYLPPIYECQIIPKSSKPSAGNMKVPPPSYDESTTAPMPNDNSNVGQYPPSPHFQASMPPQNPPISGHSPIAMDHLIGDHVGPYPQQIFCPTCRQNVVSDVKHISGLFTWILVFLFVLFGLFCGCCLLPLCVKSCKDVEHRCPQCYTYLGTYQRVFGTRRNLQRVPGRQI